MVALNLFPYSLKSLKPLFQPQKLCLPRRRQRKHKNDLIKPWFSCFASDGILEDFQSPTPAPNMVDTITHKENRLLHVTMGECKSSISKPMETCLDENAGLRRAYLAVERQNEAEIVSESR